MAIRISWNIDNRQSMNSRDSFPGRKFQNWAPTHCSPGPILWPPTISFELHAEMAEEIDLEMCSYGQLSEVQMVWDLDLDLGSGQGHVNWIGSRSCQHTQYVQYYLHAQPRDCSGTHYRNTAIWIPWNIDIPWSMNCSDTFHRKKFENRAPTGYSPGAIVSPSTISFVLRAKTAEKIKLQ